jgi:SAM-dependent methyltransferase
MKKNNPLLIKYMCEENKQKLKGMNADEIYKEYVTKAYNSFGYDFHNKVIPEVKQYLSEESLSVEESQECKLVLDIGCGNGEYKRHLESDKFYYIGVERCEVMLAVEDEVHMDGLRLGFGVGRFDVVLVVAVLHHFVTE